MSRKFLDFGIFLILFLAFSVFVSGCGQTEKDISYTSKSNQAMKYFMEGIGKNDNFYIDEARALFGKAVELDPDFAMAYYYWAVTSTTADDFQRRLARAVELADNVSEPERLVILSAKAQNDDSTGLARKYLEQLVQIRPEGLRAHFMLAVFYFGQQEWDLSIGELNKVTALDPDFAPAYNMLGYAYVNIGNYRDAIDALKRYSQLRPEDPNPHDSMGEIFLAMGDHENSIKQYKLSLKLESDFVFSMIGLGNNYLFMNEYDKARKAYDEIFDNARSTADTNTAYFWIAVSYLYEGKYEKAIEVTEENLEHAKNLSDIYMQATIHGRLAAIYREMGKFDKALEECANVKEIAERPDMQPGLKEGYVRNYLFTEIIVLARMGKKDLVSTKLEEYRQSAHASNNAVVLKTFRGLQGIVDYWYKDFQSAISHLKESDPLNQYFKYYLGLCYFKTGKEAEAKTIFSEIVGYNRNNMFYAFVRPQAAKLIK